jgi:hypothetical protein
MAGQTDEGHIRDALAAQNRLMRLLYDIGAFSLPDDPNVYAEIEHHLGDADRHTEAIRVKGDAAREAKEAT